MPMKPFSARKLRLSSGKDIIWTLSAFLSAASDSANVNGVLVTAAMDPQHGEELWRSDGTAKGTVPVRDIRVVTASGLNVGPFGDTGSGEQFVNVNGTLFSQANDGAHGLELWKAVLSK